MGIIKIILSLCCLSQDSDESPRAYSTPDQYWTEARQSQSTSTGTTLNEYGASRCPDNFDMSLRQPGHPCFVAPHMVVSPPTFRVEPPSISRRMALGMYQNDEHLMVPMGITKGLGPLSGQRSSYPPLRRRRHVQDVEFM